jgi:hypothetical protein
VLETIGSYAFSRSALVSIYPASVIDNSDAFNLCRSTRTVAIAAGSVLQSIGIYAFYN